MSSGVDEAPASSARALPRTAVDKVVAAPTAAAAFTKLRLVIVFVFVFVDDSIDPPVLLFDSVLLARSVP
jgi:hypothetical protein